MIRVALVGAGNHSRKNHAPALRRAADAFPEWVRLEAVCDRDLDRAEAARREFGFGAAFGRIEELIEKASLDAAILVMPIPQILPTARPFIERGLAVSIEKPLGRNPAEARDLVEMVERHNAPATVSLNRRFEPGLRVALQRARALGPIRHVRGVMLRVNRREADFLWGTGIHLLDLLAYVAGPLSLVSATAPTPTGRAGLLRGAEGISVAFEILPVSGRNEDRLRLVGEGYCVDCRTGPVAPWRVATHVGGASPVSEEAARSDPEFVRNGTYAETLAFLEAVRRGRPMPAPPGDVLPASDIAWRLQGMRVRHVLGSTGGAPETSDR